MIGLIEMLESKASFTEKVLKFIKQNDLSYIDGLSDYCKNKSIELEEVASLLTNEFKALLHKEAVDMNMFRYKSNKVKFDD
jgi:predicted methyltransferase